MSLRFKPEVRIRRFNYHLSELLECAAHWSLLNGITVEINSIDDGEHGVGSLHGLSLAVDFDTDGDNKSDLESLYQFMRRNMAAGYDIIHERDHVHGEWDVKRIESRIT